jgi:hypothetical protein
MMQMMRNTRLYSVASRCIDQVERNVKVYFTGLLVDPGIIELAYELAVFKSPKRIEEVRLVEREVFIRFIEYVSVFLEYDVFWDYAVNAFIDLGERRSRGSESGRISVYFLDCGRELRINIVRNFLCLVLCIFRDEIDLIFEYYNSKKRNI